MRNEISDVGLILVSDISSKLRNPQIYSLQSLESMVRYTVQAVPGVTAARIDVSVLS
jgi:hypothetical protein